MGTWGDMDIGGDMAMDADIGHGGITDIDGDMGVYGHG